MSTSFTKYRISNSINVSSIVTIHYFEFDKGYRSEGESHDFWEFVYVDKGEACAICDNSEYRLRQGEFIFHKPNEYHVLRSVGENAPNVFIISFDCSSRAMSFFKDKRGKLRADLRHLISLIIEEGKKAFDLPFNKPEFSPLSPRDGSPFGGQQLVKLYLEQLLIMLIRNDLPDRDSTLLPASENIGSPIVAKIDDILKANIYGKITVPDVCAKLNYSKTYLTRLFKASCGYTIAEYSNILKINEAKDLIRDERYNFTQISDMLNFNNPHYFSRVFRRVTGMTPSEYQRSVKID